MGLDDEYSRRKRLKDKLLEVSALQEKFLREHLERSERGSNYRGHMPGGDFPRSPSELGGDSVVSLRHDQVNPFDLPKNKVLTKNYSKVSLSPSNIMPGGAINDLDIEMRQLIEQGDARNSGLGGPRELTRNYSKATLQPGLNRNLSQKTIATLRTVHEGDIDRKIRKHKAFKKV